jgi:NADPH2:quinone reductase
MPYAIRIHETGGPEVLRWEEVEPGSPGEGEVRIRHAAVGLNFIDTYNRTGLYPVPGFPAILGREGAGVVEETGPGVTGFRPGDRVAYAGELGAYCESRTISAAQLVPLPDDVSDEQAAAVMIKGLTAWYLLHRTYAVQPGETILVHAAAGGVGLIACDWAKHLGATVIGTVGSDEKAELARAHGCDYPVIYTRDDFVEQVRELTGGRGVPVVYDSVGKDTFERSLECLSPLGMMVTFGQSSGPVPPFNVLDLSTRGSLFLTRPTLFHYVEKREELLAAAEALFEVVRNGVVNLEIGTTYPLQRAADAHRDLESRKTTGSTILIP